MHPAKFSQYAISCNKPQILPNSQEQEKMIERFESLHWKTENTLVLGTHEDRMLVIREEQNAISGTNVCFF